MTPTMWALTIVSGLLIFGAFKVRSALKSLRVETAKAWRQIDDQLRRRHEIIPEIVEKTKPFLQSEPETMDKVLEARSKAVEAQSVVEKASAEQDVSRSLTGLLAIASRFPELTADKNLADLTEELKTAESKVAFARQYYNDLSTTYNSKLEKFPVKIIATGSGLKPRELFELDDPNAHGAQEVQI